MANLDKNETNQTAILNKPKLEMFENLNFNMPSDAAILNQIIVRYTDGTGALNEKILEINKTINWQHDFSVVSRERPNLSKAIDVKESFDGESFLVLRISDDRAWA